MLGVGFSVFGFSVMYLSPQFFNGLEIMKISLLLRSKTDVVKLSNLHFEFQEQNIRDCRKP